MKIKMRTAVIAASVCVIAAIIITFLGGRDRIIDKADELKGIIALTLVKFSITDEDLVRESVEERQLKKRRYTYIFRHYKVPQDIPFKNLGTALEKSLKTSRFRIVKSDYYFTEKEEAALFEIQFKRYTIFSLRVDKARSKPAAPAKKRFQRPKVAIVLDDFGYNRRNVEAILGIGVPVTFSILPNQPYSSAIANEVNARGYEVILHLPLEPVEDHISLEPGTITTDMPEEKIAALFYAAIESVPHVSGVSNHMGSKVIQDEATMTAILTLFNEKGLFFLDSLVTNKSVAETIAREHGVPFAERSVFLDNELDEAYIRGQLYELRDIAFRNGMAIGIGHDRKETARVLNDVLPEFAEEGIRFVRVSELVD